MLNIPAEKCRQERLKVIKLENKLPKIVTAAMFAAIVCVATMMIQIPSPFKGYINLGDCIVLVIGWILSLPYSFLSAAIGAMFADIFAGYMIYAPVTFVIKGIMALMAGCCYRIFRKRIGKNPSRLLSGIVAELIMVLGYFIYEGILYGVTLSAMNVPMNMIQGVVGISLGMVIIRFFEGKEWVTK